MKKSKILIFLSFALALVISTSVVLSIRGYSPNSVNENYDTTIFSTTPNDFTLEVNGSEDFSTLESSTEPSTTKSTVIETTELQSHKSDIKTEKTNTSTIHIERTFSVNGVTIDATQSSILDETLLKMKKAIGKLPVPFFYSSCKHIIFTDCIDVHNCPEEAVGLMSEDKLYIETTSQTKNKLVYILYHETGHFLDDYYGYCYYSYISDTEDWYDVICQEGKKLCRFYGKDLLSDESSFRLETFAMATEAYYLGSIYGTTFDLKTECPKIYSCLDELFSTQFIISGYTPNQNSSVYLRFDDIDDVFCWVSENYPYTSETINSEIETWYKTASIGDECKGDGRGWGFYVKRINN